MSLNTYYEFEIVYMTIYLDLGDLELTHRWDQPTQTTTGRGQLVLLCLK